MLQKFCDYIKTAKIGDVFFSQETGLKYVITKIGKKNTYAIEIYEDKREEIQWDNEDKYKVIN